MIKEKYISKIKETSVNVVQTKIDSIRRKDIRKTGYRIYKDKLIGCAGAIGKHNQKELEKRAINALNNNIKYPYEISKNIKISEDYSGEFNEERIINEFEKLLSDIRNQQPGFSFSHKLNLIEKENILTNDNGVDLRYKDKYIQLELVIKDKSSSNLMDGFISYVGREYDNKKILNEVNEFCNAFNNKVELPKNKKLPVIFSTGEQLPMMKFLKDLHGHSFGSKSSLLSEKLNKKVFNDKFTLYQNRNPKETMEPFFDAEGVVNDGYVYTLIENGKILTSYTDKKTSKLYNLPLTGSAGAEYDGVPSLGMANLKIKESEKTAKELLQGELGILVVIAAGGDFTPEGNFATPVQLAFLYDGEKLIGRLPELKIASNVFYMFGDSFVGVSKDTVSTLSNDKCLIMNMEVSEI
ncbi:metallopeptidase TldD-related protein [Caldisalinibacter kiritimatiensis]|uniref:Metalloprotease TldD/E C-terminal domain-containing protein n=1 Tax=Caldisalinibacter kiritimatiensis TaxID=1304284 RepID=R1CFZ2_9FIRM|nr:metallopeptidase TldD-related protein [Caldisalinibacter kiritimatiensis]EOD01230.1 hypothetical protein L21TH_0706 [Caldisalinibacter kiritimatiensis]